MLYVVFCHLFGERFPAFFLSKRLSARRLRDIRAYCRGPGTRGLPYFKRCLPAALSVSANLGVLRSRKVWCALLSLIALHRKRGRRLRLNVCKGKTLFEVEVDPLAGQTYWPCARGSRRPLNRTANSSC